MGSFDTETFLKVQGQTGTGFFQSVGMSFGLPSCMLNLAAGALNLLPSSTLADIQSQITAGKAKANEITKSIFKKLMLGTGFIEFDTENGVLKFGSDSSWLGMDNDGNQTVKNLEGLLGAFNYYLATGVQLYENYTGIAEGIESVKDCIDKYKTLQAYQSGNSADQKALLSPEEAEDLFATQYAGDKARLESATSFIKNCNESIADINKVLANRAANPELEPRFVDSAEYNPYLDQTNFTRVAPEDPNLEDDSDVFRLVYGPPISYRGRYLLTSDGLYYDSQEGGLDPIFLAIQDVVPVGEKWKYNYDPNLGGKGDAISIKSLNKFSDNLFDPNLLDDSEGMESFYSEDHFLSVLKQQRDKHVYDLSSNLQTYIETYGTDSSITTNQRQLIISEITMHEGKINRRKKQIEIAVKAPTIYCGATEPLFSPGNIPINDFSFLEECNIVVDLEKQKALIFEQAEVTGMVLPIRPTFVQSAARPASIIFDHLNVPDVGAGSIIYTPSGGAGSGTLLSLTDQIVTDELFAIYNFLETRVVTPSSTNYYVTNCASTDRYNNAKLVAPNNRSVFFSGLSIPYLEGVAQLKATGDECSKGASGLGSYVRLPDTAEFRDFTYSPSGFSIDFWTHVPGIEDGGEGWLSATASSLTKCVLACENMGSKSGIEPLGTGSPGTWSNDESGSKASLNYLPNDKSDNYERGMLMGFTRDRQITKGYVASRQNYHNDPASSLSFFMAPTITRDTTSMGFINADDCPNDTNYHCMKVDLEGTNFGNVSSSFVHIAVSVDSKNNEVKMYADGELMATSSVADTFGVDAYQPPRLPSFRKVNSFEYSASSVDGPTTLHEGPKLNPFYTPWVVGGGYTDGFGTGNFMGSNCYHGLSSGLRGHIGSLKFYKKPMNSAQVAANYKAQKGYFKNIRV